MIKNSRERQPLVPESLHAFFFEGLVPERHPVLFAIGGGPASGKTTWRRRLQPAFHNYFLHDMDEVLVRLPSYQQAIATRGPKAAFEEWWPYAKELATEWVRSAIEAGYSILYDRTCGAETTYHDFLLAKQKGYTLKMTGLTVERSLASQRAKRRELEEGRATTEAIIDQFRRGFSTLWPKYLDIVDEAALFDTTSDPAKKIFSTQEGVLDEPGYRTFLEEGSR